MRTTPTLWTWFAASVARYSDEVALEVGEDVLTYAALDTAAARLAAAIEAAAGRGPRRVGLLASHSVTAYAGYLAALRLGATVVPLNPRFPLTRNLSTIAATGLDVVLADEHGAEQSALVAEQSTASILVVDGAATTRMAGDPRDVVAAVDVDPGEIAYILFTSGSTGRPRGVPIRHRHIAPLLEWTIQYLGVVPGDRVSQNCELTFDPSVHMMFTAWGAGGTLVVPSPSEAVRPAPFVNRKRITVWFTVPAMAALARQAGGLEPGSMPTLTRVMFGADRLTPAVAEAFARAAPHSRLYNSYGPTEVSVLCAASRLGSAEALRSPGANGTYPIGNVLSHMEYVILDSDMEPAAAGELCVRGSQRFDGYLDPADNVDRFLEWEVGSAAAVYSGEAPLTDRHWDRTGDRVTTEDGELVFGGRIDFQVKIRGHRVELGEVESVLRRHPAIDEAVVVVHDTDLGPSLIAVYTGEAVAAKELVAFVREQLPVYMLPSRFCHQDFLPVTANGKVDRTAQALGR